MKAEIVAIGTELLLGQIVNTNAQYLSQQLAHLGIDVYIQTVVGDNETRLKQCLELASERADVVICTGGLGPTMDDITKEVLAAITGQSIVMHEPTRRKIAQFYEARQMAMPENNERQAWLLEGSTPLFNDVGMAVGIAMQHEETHYILLPGPPQEMRAMFERYAIEWLQRKLTTEQPLFSKTLKFVGIGESSLETELNDVISNQLDPTLALYAAEGEVGLRLSTKAASAAQAEEKFAPFTEMIYERLGHYIYGTDEDTLEQVLIGKLRARQLTVSVAESCTGGLLAHLLTSVPGSSAVFKGGIVCYDNEIKARVLNVPWSILIGEEAPGAISAETATHLAEQIAASFQTDFGIAITGIAGPSTVENKPVGLVYTAIKVKDHPVQVWKYRHAGNRDMINLKSAKFALAMLWQIVSNEQ